MDKAPFFPQVAEGPQNAEAYWTTTDDGHRIRVVHWPNAGASQGTIFIFQGRTENIEKYGRAVDEFHKAGFGAFALDWRGQGLSDRLTVDRMMGHVGQFADYQKDVAAFLNAAHELNLPKPWHLFGHSLGACVGLRALIEDLPVCAAVFSAPLWDINLSRFQRAAAWPLSWTAQTLGKGATYAPGTKGESYVLTTNFSENRLTHDPNMYRYYQSISEELRDQQIGGPSLGWLYQTLKETSWLSKLVSPCTPCLTFCGAEDTIVAIPAVEDRMNRWANGTFNLVPDARHDVLYETEEIRRRVFDAMLQHFKHAGA